MFDELAMLADALNTLGDLTPRSLDAIAVAGRADLVRARRRRVQAARTPAVHVDARQVVDHRRRATRAPSRSPTRSPRRRSGCIMPLLREGRFR